MRSCSCGSRLVVLRRRQRVHFSRAFATTTPNPRMCRDARAFAILGVDSSATQAAVKSAYHKMAVKTHPDANHSKEYSDEEAKFRFQQVQWAYDKIVNSLNDNAQQNVQEMSQLKMYKDTIQACLDEGSLDDVPDLFSIIKADHENESVSMKIDAKLVGLIIDLCAQQGQLRQGLDIAFEVACLQPAASDAAVIKAYESMLNYCEESLDKQFSSGDWVTQRGPRAITIAELIESLHKSTIELELRALIRKALYDRLWQSQHYNSLNWLCQL